MRDAGNVKGFIRVIVWLNLATLLAVFAGPRLWFMATHSDMTQAQYLRTPGAYDLPNMYWQSFELAEAIRLATPKNATIFLPEAGGPGMEPSAFYKTLLPRQLYFKGSPEYSRYHGVARKLARSWQVIPAGQKKSCRKKSVEKLADTGYWLCRLDR